ncbi:MAG: hypothetical protein ACOZCL_04650 [Bacillota bacterium]
MRKTKFLIMVLVVSIMLMGAGYAAWTDQLVINNTVSTGELDVQMLQEGSTVVVNDELTNREAECVVNMDSEGEYDLAEVTITNLYPGAVATVTIPVQNTGDIPVLLQSATNTNGDTNYTVSVSAPSTIGLDETKNLVYTVVVGNDAPENQEVKFTVNIEYKQFNM